MQCSIRFNNAGCGAECPSCHEVQEAEVGYQVCRDELGMREEFEILCPECAQRHAPELAALLDAATAAFRF
jgi:hypothetical protein